MGISELWRVDLMFRWLCQRKLGQLRSATNEIEGSISNSYNYYLYVSIGHLFYIIMFCIGLEMLAKMVLLDPARDVAPNA